jgi:hypothetical protein
VSSGIVRRLDRGSEQHPKRFESAGGFKEKTRKRNVDMICNRHYEI